MKWRRCVTWWQWVRYPGEYEKGILIEGLKKYKDEETIVFHSGTKQNGKEILTNGGRVLAVTSFGKDVSAAAQKSKEMLRHIHFEGINYRRDIGYEFIEAGESNMHV